MAFLRMRAWLPLFFRRILALVTAGPADTARAPFGWVPLPHLLGARRNPRRHYRDRLVTLIQRFGFTAPPVLDATTGRLVAGHGRVEALRHMHERGDALPEGLRADGGAWLVPVRYVRLASPEEAEACLLADNKASDHASYDQDELRAMLDGLAREERALDLGWTERELSRILAPVEPGLDPLDEAEPEEKTRHLTITYAEDAFAHMLPRLARAQARHRAPTYAALLDVLLSLSEEST